MPGPEGLLQRLALALDIGPVPAAQAFFPMASSRVAMAGVRLGIMRLLARGPATTAQLAEQLTLDPHGLGLLLEALEELGHVKARRGVMALTPAARRWLDPASPTYVGTFVELNYLQWEWWSKLEESIRTGKGVDLHQREPGDPSWDLYVTGMYELARLAAPEVARRIPLKAGARILDLGGAHGWFAAELCQRTPEASAVVIDLPGAARVGRAILAARGLSDRVQHVEGDALRRDLGGPYQLILCSQLLHHLSPADCRALLHRAAAALAPGGVLAVLDFFVKPRGKRPGFATLLGLHYLLTSGAQAFRRTDLEGFLEGTGLSSPTFVGLRRLPLLTLCLSRRGGGRPAADR